MIVIQIHLAEAEGNPYAQNERVGTHPIDGYRKGDPCDYCPSLPANAIINPMNKIVSKTIYPIERFRISYWNHAEKIIIPINATGVKKNPIEDESSAMFREMLS